MSIDAKLLEILRCPFTKQPLYPLASDRLRNLNALIRSGEIHYEDGTVVNSPFEAGLITENGSRVYRITSGIPIMLHAQSIRLTETESAG